MRPTPTAGRFLSVVVVVLALGAGLLVGLGAADTSELLNETVEVDNNSDPVTIAVEFSDDFNDSSTDVASVEATFYNETEFNDSGTNATVLHTVTIEGKETERIVQDVYFEDHANLEYNETTRLVVEGDAEKVETVEIEGGLIGGVIAYGDAQPGFGVGVAVLALAFAGVAARARGGD
ncbi:hypothetical protein [Natronosalvus halobius]|uniref:hypothetical protein n=1 Tax=Natronosalvus halobius TaxID=2953746 RepID=UPI0020A23406|nr:hypothetical protein [Natronosalvus halobius]USZ71993.1 hypothetical protein NGM15_01405 [Natronosalvus halobius]